MLFEYSLNNLAFIRYSKMQLLLPLIPKMFLGFLGPQNSKNDKIYFRIIIRFIRYGSYPVTSLIYIYSHRHVKQYFHVLNKQLFGFKMPQTRGFYQY